MTVTEVFERNFHLKASLVSIGIGIPQQRLRSVPNPKSPKATNNKLDGSGTEVVSTVVTTVEQLVLLGAP